MAFKFLFGLWVLLVPVLSSSYLSLSIISISSPLESKSVTSFNQLAKPGCGWGKMECHLGRIKGFEDYINTLRDYLLKSWSTFVSSYPPSLHAVSLTREALRNRSIRRFDANHDFVLLPYSFEENLFNEQYQYRNNFGTRLIRKLYTDDDGFNSNKVKIMG